MLGWSQRGTKGKGRGRLGGPCCSWLSDLHSLTNLETVLAVLMIYIQYMFVVISHQPVLARFYGLAFTMEILWIVLNIIIPTC